MQIRSNHPGNASIAMLVVAMFIVTLFAMAAFVPDTAYAAGKTKMWVITKTTNWRMPIDPKYKGHSIETYSYNSNGLIKSVKESGTKSKAAVCNGWKRTYSYDKKHRLKMIKETYKGRTYCTTTYKINSKGRIVKGTCRLSDGGLEVYTYSYDKKGQLKKSTLTVGSDKDTTKYYYNPDGSLKTIKTAGVDDKTGKRVWYPTTYVYDEYGNIISDGSTDGEFRNTYKNGRLAKQSEYSFGDLFEKNTYSYKQITVPKSCVKKVRGQQLSILPGILPIEAA